MRQPLIVIGAGGHAVSVANVAESSGFSVKYFVDTNRAGGSIFNIPIFADIVDSLDYTNCNFAIAIGDNANRERVYNEMIEKCRSISFPPLIHNSVVVSIFSDICEGSVIMPGVVIGPNTKIGKFCILNTRASIDHDSVMSDFSSLAPGVVTGGTVSIGIRSVVSIGAIVKHNIEIGNDSVLGASSYLNKNLSSNKLAYGVPAKVIRSMNKGDPYIK